MWRSRTSDAATQSQTQETPSVTTSSEPSTAVTEQPATEIPGEFTGKVVKVIDGDTIDVLTGDKQTIRIRLNGIDCPERGQPFGNTATQVLNIFILGNVVKVVPHGQDRCERTIGVSAGNRNRSVVLKPAK